MSAIQILVDEHDQILTMIKVTKAIFENDAAEKMPVEDVNSLIDFIQNFADKYHHLKEEDILFKEMENYGMSTESGPLAVMLHEHNQGRAFIQQAIAGISKYTAGDISAYKSIKENLLGYGELLSNHINKENNILYPMAERILPHNVLDKLNETFENTNTGTRNNEYFDKYLKMVETFNIKYLIK